MTLAFHALDDRIAREPATRDETRFDRRHQGADFLEREVLDGRVPDHVVEATLRHASANDGHRARESCAGGLISWAASIHSTLQSRSEIKDKQSAWRAPCTSGS